MAEITLQKPVFIETDPAVIIAECKAYYESLTGKPLEPAQAETLILNVFAYREVTTRNAIQAAAEQNLVDFSRAPMLDYLGRLVGVNRLAASPAEAQFQFSLISGHGAITIPQGIRIGSTDGLLVFLTKEARTVQVSDTVVTIPAACSAPGKGANGIPAATSWVLLDPLAYVDAVNNITITAGGADEETDDELRARIKLAPSAFSTAGPKGAYIFHAKSAHPSIIDVGVTSLTPGTVNIYPLVEGGGTPSAEVIDAVYIACNADKVRPLSDTVVVAAPTKITYDISVNLTLLNESDETTIAGIVTDALNAYAVEGRNKLGQDRMRAQIIALCQIKGVYNTVVTSPAADIVVSETSFAECGTVSVNVTGFNQG